MNRSSLAAAISALTLALALPTIAHSQATGATNADQNASTPTAQSSTNTTGTDQTSTEGTTKNAKDAKKHPPTAAMDKAAPPDKSPSGKSTAAKHPPTAAMDSATPAERSPGSKSEQDSSAQPSAPGAGK
jgi:hypothetical protein